MNAFQKVLVSFLFSVFLFTVVVFFTFDEGMLSEPEELLILASVFLTLFLMIFFCFNVRQNRVPEMLSVYENAGITVVPTADEPENLESLPLYEELEELEAADSEETAPAAFKGPKSPGLQAPNVLIAFGDDDIPYLVESSGLELVNGDIADFKPDEIARFIENAQTEEEDEKAEAAEELEGIEVVSPFASMLPLLADTQSGEIAELEEFSTGSGGAFSLFRQPGVHAFTVSSGNPELLDAEGIHAQDIQGRGMLQKAVRILQETRNQVIYERNGIHYINNNLDSGDSALDVTFANLVNEVVNTGE